MKNKILLTLIAISLLFVNCTDKEYEAPSEISTVGFYTSTGRKPAINVALLNYTTFSDLSQGAIEHSWTIDEGNFFLEGPIGTKSKIEDFERKIINSGKLKSDDKTIIVYFKKAGIQNVRLLNVFKDSVTFNGYRNEKSYELGSKNIDGKWVIDTTFAVKVFDTIVPKVIVRRSNGDIIDHTSTDTIKIEAGDFLNFEDVTTQGEPTDYLWQIKEEGNNKFVAGGSNDKNANILFTKLGNFNASIKVSRFGKDIPNASKTFNLKSPIKVIPSTKKYILTSLKEAEDQTIQVAYNGEFSAFDMKLPVFKVTVNGVESEVEEISINKLNKTIIDIKLKETIYSDDNILVSFIDNTDILSIDSRTPTLFNDVKVKMYNPNLLPKELAGFENGSTGWLPFAPAWGINQGTVEFSKEQVLEGEYSIKLTSTGGKRLSINTDPSKSLGVKFDGTKKYVFKYSMYLESSSILPKELSFWFLNEWSKKSEPSPDQVKGEWITVKEEFTTTDDLLRLYIRVLPNDAATSDYTIYLDDLSITEIDLRP